MRPTVASVWPAFSFYVQNIVYHGGYPFGLGATWSLAVEEQFYLTWPILVFLLKNQTLSILSVCLVLLSTSLRALSHPDAASSGVVQQFRCSPWHRRAFG